MNKYLDGIRPELISHSPPSIYSPVKVIPSPESSSQSEEFLPTQETRVTWIIWNNRTLRETNHDFRHIDSAVKTYMI